MHSHKVLSFGCVKCLCKGKSLYPHFKVNLDWFPLFFEIQYNCLIIVYLQKLFAGLTLHVLRKAQALCKVDYKYRQKRLNFHEVYSSQQISLVTQILHSLTPT